MGIFWPVRPTRKADSTEHPRRQVTRRRAAWYCRHRAEMATGQQAPETPPAVQNRHRTCFDDSPAWRKARPRQARRT